jgi:phosphotriesterase-related protein
MNYQKPLITTVNGRIDPGQGGIMDAHNHVWIDRVPGVRSSSPVLNDFASISAELSDFKIAGGSGIVDCQPGGCGRNGNVLRQLAVFSGINLIACTGYHLKKYYPDGFWLFNTTVEDASQHFIQELDKNLHETREEPVPVRAGFIKIAFEESLEQSPIHLMEAAVAASLATGAAIQAHTERGLDVERIVQRLIGFGLSPSRLIISHIDKRPDLGLHSSLVQEGVLLEYDTFYRPKYQPDKNLWPLIRSMVEAGLEDGIALATDMAEPQFWTRMGGGPGLTGMFHQIIPRLSNSGLSEDSIQKLSGKNIAHRLASN